LIETQTINQKSKAQEKAKEYEDKLQKLYSDFVFYIQNIKIHPGYIDRPFEEKLANWYDTNQDFLTRMFLELDYELAHTMFNDTRLFEGHVRMRLSQKFSYYFQEESV
jgi:hypothetical protein